ncbi:MFS transporter [Lactiplantibacillus fabifermentans]|uniref:Transport protein n=2 Tax=Lactiplantibacillus fabifermentans TaxID=483011 RepID=A0A0R2NNU6_9LACO|nr:MFS transporter [Lactiplantibacillus fabifermentans]ETY73131.1 major facilitator transporter [Lactiplantibacillus fabifermentans T30PCM01]KRO25523.1 transport protein [Lactiplantibacillus fabifermentans DSM 21115]
MQLFKKYRLLTVIGTAWLFDAMDVAMLSFIMPLIKKEWQLAPAQLGMVSAATSLGMVVGAIICGVLADRIGRKKVLIYTLALFSIGNLLLTITPNVGLFIAVRFLTGIGLGGELPVAATLVADSYQGTERSRMLVLADSFWAIGWIVASLLAFWVMPVIGWRLTVLITAVTILYTLLLRRHLPDTPVRTTKKPSWRVVWQPEYRRMTITMAALWFIVMLTYYGMFLWLPSLLVLRGFPIVHSFNYTLLMSLAQLPGYYLAAYLMGKMSRKVVLMIYLTGTILSALAFSFASSNGAVLMSGAWLSFFDLGAWGTLIALTPSLFPQAIRGTGMGTAQSIGRIGATIGPYMVGMLLQFKLPIPVIFSVFVVMLLIGIGILVFAVVDPELSPDEELAHELKG